MSRTDKDRPLRVIQNLENYPINHDHRFGDCEIETLRTPRARCRRAWSDGTDRRPVGRFGPDADELHLLYHDPERRRVRDELHRALRAWNAGDPLDDFDLANHQARNSVSWLM
jgi:hypothetical protein